MAQPESVSILEATPVVLQVAARRGDLPRVARSGPALASLSVTVAVEEDLASRLEVASEF
jgi:hypothetical protein